MNNTKKTKIVAVLIVLIIAIIALANWMIRYRFYNKYQTWLTKYETTEGSTYSPLKDSSSNVKGMDLVAENDILKLYVDTKIGNVAVYDKRNGETIYTNPVDVDSDSIATATNLNYLKSQLVVDYFNLQRTQGTFDSYSYCVALDQLEAQSIENGVKLIYTLGDMSSATGIAPQYISKDTLESFADKMDEKDKKEFLKKYKETSVAPDYYEMLEGCLNGPAQLRKLIALMEKYGFTEEMYIEEMMGSGVEGAVPISFTIPLEYRLNNDGVDVTIPMSEVIEAGGAKIFRIQFLRAMDAASTKDNGYFLVPNGSGSIINFNNGKTSADNYSDYIYGIDPLAAEYTVKEKTEPIKLALFGIEKEKSTVLATLEDGASTAFLTAGVSGKVSDYNTCFPTFVVRGYDKLSMFGTTGNEGAMTIIESDLMPTNITVKYTLLDDSHKGYSGMANYQREKLVDNGVLSANEQEGDIKFYYDILGGVEETKFFLGTQYQGMHTMTTFAEAKEIADDLANNYGITNQVMNYAGWMNGGYNHDVINKVKIPRALGSRRALVKLSDYISDNYGSFYADTAIQKVATTSKRYKVNSETSRYYGAGYVAEFGLVNPTSLRQTSGLGYDENRFYLISPKFLVRNIKKFDKKLSHIDIEGLSLRDLGTELHSDKKRTNIITREEALDVVEGQLQILEDSGKKLMMNAGNDYSFAYAKDIINAPLTDNDYYLVDETVPFYEMLLHGYIDYSSTVINLSDSYDKSDMVRELIETGASPHFMFTYRDSSEMKTTALNRYYATTYINWRDYAKELYDEVNAVLSQVNGAYIIEHEIDGDVRVVTYSNGVKIYVNNGGESAVKDGVKIDAKSYAVGGGR